MSMTLILWKGPLVREAKEAEKLLKPFYDREDESAFESNEAIRLVWNELLSRYPDDGSVERPEDDPSPWADFPPYVSDRLLVLDIRWSADPAALDDIQRLARAHELVLYDPQGPDVHLPTDPEEPPEVHEKLGFGAYAMAIGVTLLGLAVLVAGWMLPVPVINWLLIVAGLFILGVGATLDYAFFVVAGQMRREAEAKRASEGPA
ncbi:MAG TPA: hypothetical protein VGB54_05270 [Allosphingosinicella sp.]